MGVNQPHVAMHSPPQFNAGPPTHTFYQPFDYYQNYNRSPSGSQMPGFRSHGASRGPSEGVGYGNSGGVMGMHPSESQRTEYEYGEESGVQVHPVSGAWDAGNVYPPFSGIGMGVGGAEHSSSPTCLFVYNLPDTTDETLLYQLFSPFGQIHSVKVIVNPNTTVCKGFGFVNMVSISQAQSAIQSLNGFFLGNKPLQVSIKREKQRGGNQR